MRIAIFSDTFTPEINGVVSSVVTLKEGLQAQGHEVFVVTTHPSLLTISYENRVLRLPGLQLKQMYGYVLTSPVHIRAYKMIKDMKLDLIHAHTEFGIGIFARIIARLIQCPMVVTYHTTYEDYTHYVNLFNSKTVDQIAKRTVKQLSKLHIERSDGAIAPSLKTKRMLESYGIQRTIHVIPTGLDLDRFHPSQSSSEQIQALRERYQVKDEKLVIFVGRIAKEKSIDLVIDGFALAYQENPHMRLWIVGSGPVEQELKHKVQKLNLSHIITFVGKIPALEIPQYYHAADVFVSASLTETQGMTFIEALSSGTIVFARPDDVLSDLIEEGNNGYYFHDAQEFATKLLAYVNLDSHEQMNLRQKAMASVQSYDRSVFINKVVKVYQEALEETRQAMVLDYVKFQDDVVECHFIKKERRLELLVSKEEFVDIGLRKGNSVDRDTLESLMVHEQFVKAYQKAIRKLASRDRTRKEMYDYLIEQSTLDIQEINLLIEQLEKKGYINDLKYAQEMSRSLKSMLQGRRRIQQNLRKKGIPKHIIEQVIEEDDVQLEIENATVLAEKIKEQIKDASVRSTKQKLTQRLVGQGYDFNIIEQVIAKLSFLDIENDELEIMRKLATKLRRRYEKKLHGTALRNSIFNSLDRQGFNLDDIYVILNEMEWHDESN
jgi:1,2-diacylglycerol 3-alpha-glucosyltransferase